MRRNVQKRQARYALLVDRARHMLHAPPPSEARLWLALRDGALGVAFKRQVVIGERCIADFFAPSVGLVVEVDGSSHWSRGAADRRRDKNMRALGYRIVRVDAGLVLRDVDAALGLIGTALASVG